MTPTPLEILAAEARASRTVIVALLDEEGRRVTWEVEPYALDDSTTVRAVVCCRAGEDATVSIPVRDIIAARASGRAFSPRRAIDL